MLSKKVAYMIFKYPISDYTLGKKAQVLEQSINKIHLHKSKLGNMSLKNAEKIGQLYNKIVK